VAAGAQSFGSSGADLAPAGSGQLTSLDADATVPALPAAEHQWEIAP
jgi:hypothetical protein